MTRTTVRPIHLAFGLIVLSWGCGSGAGDLTGATAATAAADGQTVAADARNKATGLAVTCQGASGSQCLFDKGQTTCTRTLSQRTELAYHDEISGCMAYDGSVSRPGRRTRHYEDTWAVSEIETTHARGQCGQVYDTSTADQRQLVLSRLISDVCDAI